MAAAYRRAPPGEAIVGTAGGAGAPHCRRGVHLLAIAGLWRGLVAEWLRSGLQIRARRFDSGPGLHKF